MDDAGNRELSNRHVLSCGSGSWLMSHIPSTCVASARNRVNDNRRTTGVLLSPRSPRRYLETNTNLHLVMNYGWRWNACSRPASLQRCYLQSQRKMLLVHGRWNLLPGTYGIVRSLCTVMDCSVDIKHIKGSRYILWEYFQPHRTI